MSHPAVDLVLERRGTSHRLWIRCYRCEGCPTGLVHIDKGHPTQPGDPSKQTKDVPIRYGRDAGEVRDVPPSCGFGAGEARDVPPAMD
jgi:hypothetical protein